MNSRNCRLPIFLLLCLLPVRLFAQTKDEKGLATRRLVRQFGDSVEAKKIK